MANILLQVGTVFPRHSDCHGMMVAVSKFSIAPMPLIVASRRAALYRLVRHWCFSKALVGIIY